LSNFLGWQEIKKKYICFVKSLKANNMKNRLRKISLAILMLISLNSFAQNASQTIRGTVIDKQSQIPLQGVLVIVLNSNPTKSAESDEKGNFKLTEIEPGRYDLKVKMGGYKETTISNVLVTAGKEIVLDVAIEESVEQIKEITVSGQKKTI
jgi:uncharacterized membrane protein